MEWRRPLPIPGWHIEDDIRRVRIAREVIGPERKLMIDANQVWEVDAAIPWVKALAFANDLHHVNRAAHNELFEHNPVLAHLAGGDLHRADVLIGPERKLMIDANQVWEVDAAIPWVKALAFANPWSIAPRIMNCLNIIRFWHISPVATFTAPMFSRILRWPSIGGEVHPAGLPARRRRRTVRIRPAPVDD
jgi:hypothetical protein